MKWAFVGASNIAAEWMVGAVRAVGDEVVAVVSGSADRAGQFAREQGIAHALTREQDLASVCEVDAVYISSTNEKHEASVLHAAAMGWHVLCEKPVATDLAAAHRMVQACKDAGVVMAVNHHLRHNAAHRKMRDIIRQGGVGRPIAARVCQSVGLPAKLQGWRINDPSAGGGVVLDIAVHNADSLAFLLGEYPTEVMAMTGSTGMAAGVEDNAMSLWRFPSGLTAMTHQGFNTPYASNRLELYGERGGLEGTGVLNQAPGGELLWLSEAGRQSVELDGDNLYVRCLREMHRSMAGQDSDVADGLAGLKSLAVALAVLESARSGKAVPVAAV